MKAEPSGVSEISIADAAEKEKYFLKKFFQKLKKLVSKRILRHSLPRFAQGYFSLLRQTKDIGQKSPSRPVGRIAHCKMTLGVIS